MRFRIQLLSNRFPMRFECLWWFLHLRLSTISAKGRHMKWKHHYTDKLVFLRADLRKRDVQYILSFERKIVEYLTDQPVDISNDDSIPLRFSIYSMLSYVSGYMFRNVPRALNFVKVCIDMIVSWKSSASCKDRSVKGCLHRFGDKI